MFIVRSLRKERLTNNGHLHRKYPKGYKKKNATKRLAAIAKLAFDIIPQDPTRTGAKSNSPSPWGEGVRG
jgi:hypothetical protein